MSYSKVRTYLEKQILDQDDKLKKHSDVFNTDNVPKTKIDKSTYHVFYSVPSINRLDTSVESNVDALITLEYSAQRDVEKVFDAAMNSAEKIMKSCASMESMYQFRATDDYPIQRVNPVSIIATPIDTNDNSFKIELSMELLIMENIC